MSFSVVRVIKTLNGIWAEMLVINYGLLNYAIFSTTCQEYIKRGSNDYTLVVEFNGRSNQEGEGNDVHLLWTNALHP